MGGQGWVPGFFGFTELYRSVKPSFTQPLATFTGGKT
jgi:hypothetical protein